MTGTRWTAAGLLLGALCGAVQAATLTGQVTADGQPVAGAWVQLNTGQIVVTDARGRYSFPQVPQATHALQVFAPGKEPAVLGSIVTGKGKANVALAAAEAPLGLIHVKATTPDGTMCPVRIVTRWQAADGAEWQTPAELTHVSTLDGRGQPLVPAAEDRSSIVPFGACLWTKGEAVLALPPGQAELTCTSGVLMRATQQTVEVKPNEVVEAAVSMTRGSELDASGWSNGALRVQIGGAEAGYLVGIALMAAICRAEGFDWIVLGAPYGNDPVQPAPRQAAAEVSGDDFAAWLAPGAPGDPWNGRVVAVGQEQSVPAGVPGYYASGLLKRAVTLHVDPLGADPAREFPFDVVADPSLFPLLNIEVANPAGEDYLRLWTLLADHGLRLGCATVGDSQIGQGRLPIRERTFVQTTGKLSLAEVVDGLQRAATFVTTGPVLSLLIGDVGPGGTLPPDDQTRVAEIDAVLGCMPGSGVTRVELVRGGRAVRTWDVSELGPNHVQARLAVRENEPTWFALRAYGAGPSEVAYTSPIFVADPAQSSPGPREARFTGTVVDDATGAPVAGARITATAPGQRPVSTITGADGRYGLVAPVTAALEVSHPRYPRVEAPTSSVSARATATTKFVAWDCVAVRAVLDSVTPQSLLTWDLYQQLEAAVASPTIDFRLKSR